MKTSSAAVACSALLLCLGACGSDGGAAPSGATSVALPLPAPTASAPEPAASAIPPAEAQKVVDAWLAAQNAGDLTAYLALYAERFEGVKRSGERTTRMDRKAWAADRSKMFGKKMVVTAEDVAVTTAQSTAQVSFTQTWASGSYKDVGPKLLVLAREKGALRIAREEMLASKIEGVKRLPRRSAEQFAFVLQDGGPRVVLDTAPQLAWAGGAPQLLADAVPFPVKVPVKAGVLPAGLAAWAGKKMRLYGPAGPVCEATLGAPSLIGRVIPHFGEVARWHGTAEPGQKPLSKPEIAASAWALSAGANPAGVVLAAELTAPTGDCKAALWAQPASEPERKVAKAEPAPAPLAKKALDELRKLPEYKEFQEPGAPKPFWDERGRTETVLMRHPSGKQLVFISSNAVEGCGGFQGNLSAVFEVTGDRLQLAGKPASSPPEMPSGAIDVGDGKVEILFTERLLRGEAGYDQVDMLRIPFLDCEC